jgi:D-alanyl-D-alanine dipeptidase
MQDSTGDRAILTSDLIDVDLLDPSIKLSIRYATSQNFLRRPFYSQPRALLQIPVALSLVEAHRELMTLGYGLIIFDAYRPLSVTELFWELTPKDKRQFVADPSAGSVHNRGCAVDVSLYSIGGSIELDMPSEYDEMSERAVPSYQGGSMEQRRNRDTLRRTMEQHEFTVHPVEWWHFDHNSWPRYPVENRPFSDIPRRRAKDLIGLST